VYKPDTNFDSHSPVYSNLDTVVDWAFDQLDTVDTRPQPRFPRPDSKEETAYRMDLKFRMQFN
jgi:hypothetical protein